MPYPSRLAPALLAVLAGCYGGGAYMNCAVTCNGDALCPGGATCNNNRCPAEIGGTCGVAGRDADTQVDGHIIGIDASAPPDAGPLPECSTGNVVGTVVPYCFTGNEDSIVDLSGATPFDSSNCTMTSGFLTTTRDGRTVCAIVGDTVSLSGYLTFKQTEPVSVPYAIIARDTLMIGPTTTVSVSSGTDPNNNEVIGAGAIFAGSGCAPGPTLVGTQASGAAGGSFGTLGGAGGSTTGGTNAGGMPETTLYDPNDIRGGCVGGNGSPGGPAAFGGGGLYLASGDLLDLEGTVVAGGEGGPSVIDGSGGTGGASGGMIVLEALDYMGTGSMYANGGGGAAGADDSSLTKSTAGGDANSSSQAAGGLSPSGGANGGDGSYQQSNGGAGAPNISGRGGGGGGGGGAGVIELITTDMFDKPSFMSDPPYVLVAPQ